jgi:hypothetical protein
MFFPFLHKVGRVVACALAFAVLPAASYAQDNKNLAPGFTVRPVSSKLVILPADMELFSISAGGVREPKADWTQSAVKHFKDGLDKRKELLGANVVDLAEKDLDEVAEVNALHGAVAQSVFLHHVLSVAKLPTKAGVLDWSLGDSVKPLKAKTGADYALFVWIRDSYASSERKAAMVVMAILGVGLQGGSQIGYASLVDLNNGRIVWFNDLRRASGDLREAQPAQETVEALLKGFPVSK